MSSEQIDIKQLIESGSESADLSELVQRGYKRVRIVDDVKIEAIVQEAVENVISGRAEDMALRMTKEKLAEQKDEFKQQATKEFKRLLTVHKQALKMRDEIRSSRDTLQNEVEAMRAELSNQHGLIEQLSDQSHETEANAQQQRLESIETEMNALLSRLESSDKERRSAEDHISQLTRRLQDVERERLQQEDKRKQNSEPSDTLPPASVGEQLRNILSDIKSTGLSESGEDLEDQVKEYRHRFQDMQQSVDQLTSDIRDRESSMGSQTLLVQQLEKRCQQKEDHIQKIQQDFQSELESMRKANAGQRERDQAELGQLESQIGSQEDLIEQRKRQIDELYREKNDFKHRLDELESQVNSGTFQPIEGDTRGSQIQQVLAQEQHLEKEIQTLWTSFQTKEQAITPLLKKRDEVRSRFTSLSDPNDPQLPVLREQELNLNAAIQGMEDERNRISRTIKNNRIKLGELRGEREGLQREVASNCQYLFDELRSQQTQREHQIVNLETERTRLQREIKQLNGRQESLQSRYAYEKQKEEQIRLQLESETQSLQTLQTEREELESHNASIRNDVDSMRDKHTDLESQLQTARDSMESRASHVALAMRLEDATSLIDDLLQRNQEMEETLQKAQAEPAAVSVQPNVVAPPPVQVQAPAQTQIYGPYNTPVIPYVPGPPQPYPYPQALPQQASTPFMPMLKPLPKRTPVATPDPESQDMKQKLDIMAKHIEILERKLESERSGVPEADIPYEDADPNLVIVLEPRKNKFKK